MNAILFKPPVSRELRKREDTDNLKLLGVVTEHDVCCGVAADDRYASEVRVEEIMRPSSASCSADEPVEGARRKLHEHRATSLHVMDKGGGWKPLAESCGRQNTSGTAQ